MLKIVPNAFATRSFTATKYVRQKRIPVFTARPESVVV
jgi:hypothetical protein